MGSKASYRVDVDIEAAAAGVPIVTVGDRFTGTAFLTPGAELKLNELRVELVWRAHGKGSPDEGVVGKTVPPTKQLAAGQEVEIPFEFQVPDTGPISWDGEYVKLNWMVRIYLDIPWAIDDEESFPLLVLPRSEE